MSAEWRKYNKKLNRHAANWLIDQSEISKDDWSRDKNYQSVLLRVFKFTISVILSFR